MTEHFDAIIVGAGQAGPALAARLDREGLNTALIERDRMGGTCVNVGCTPTKTMVGSARAIRMAQRGGDFGFSTGTVAVDMKAVKARKDAIVQQSSDGVTHWVESMRHVTLIRGDARFTAPRTLQVGDRALVADKVFLNVGGRPLVPEIPGVDSVPFLTSSTLLDLEEVPEHLLIIGGSYIGLEFAQVFRRLGAQVTVVEKADKLLPREDDEITAGIRSILEHEGVVIRTGAQCMQLGRRGTAITVGLACGEGAPVAEGSHLLLAVGRVPNTDGLGLDLAGVATDARGYVTVDEQCRTSAEGVWCMGDANGRGAFTHTSWNDHEIVVANLFDNDPRKISDRISCYGLFIDPPLGRVGMNEAQARASGRRLLAATMPMTRVGRAREMGETQGLMKVLVDADSRQLLGAALLGLGGDEVVHSLLVLMYAQAPCDTLQRAVHVHPTVTELLPTLFGMLKPLA